MSSTSFLSSHLSEKTSIFGLRLWVVLGIGVGAFIVLVLVLLALWLLATGKSNATEKVSTSSGMIPTVCKDIKEVVVQVQEPRSLKHSNSNRSFSSLTRKGHILSTGDISDVENEVVTFGFADTSAPDGVKVVKGRSSQRGLMQHHGNFNDSQRNTKGTNFEASRPPVVNLDDVEKRGLLVNSNDKTLSVSGSGAWDTADSPGAFMVTFTTSLPEGLPLSWGFRYTLRDLQLATNHFSDSNVLGKGGYGIVYQGRLPDGSSIAVKNLLNNRGQAEREFRIEVEAIGRVRHKNLVRLLGYCGEGSYRMLVYEYVNNGNLQQWLHGAKGEKNPIPWEGRMKIVLETAKGLAYLHEDLDPKIIHRDVKSSNILLDNNWNVKISDFGLAKFIGSGMTHVMTRVMGTFGYVAPEYANTGMLTEKSDVYSFGVLMMELITGKDPVDYGRPTGEVNLVDWMKVMIGSRRSEEVVDLRLPVKPSARALKRALLVALRCVDPDAEKRPKMGHVIHMLEADDFPIRTVVKQQSTPRER